jgi:peptidoglycan/LPS O-acetylase OafA/YrhL
VTPSEPVADGRGAAAKSEASSSTTNLHPRHHERLGGLDGLRGLSVVAVVLFHLWPKILPGGFIGVSVFFTLSGFLITRGLIRGIDRTAGLGLRSFWGRRIRRLWPASSACLALIVTVWLAFQWLNRSISLDVFASLFQVANWRFLASGKAYGLSELSPVAHFWSLAIEEQLYLVVPVMVWLARRRSGTLFAAFSALIALSLIETYLHAGDAPVVYYSTFTRAAELAAGGLLAVVVRRVPVRSPRHGAGVTLGVAGLAAIIALTVLCARTSLGTDAYYNGALSALAVLSVVAIIGAIWSPQLSRFLSLRLLTWFGAISYGIYLIHWPVRVALTHTSLPAWFQPWLTLAITLVVAPISLRFFENPIRLRSISLRQFAPAAIGLTSVIIIGSSVGLRIRPASELDFGAALAHFNDLTKPATTGPVEGDIGTATNPAHVAIFGDSTALMLGFGLGWNEPRIQPISGGAALGCSIGRSGRIRGDALRGDDPTAPAGDWQSICDWTTAWPSVISAAGGIDVAVILTGNWDLAGRNIPALGNSWRSIGDPVYDAWLTTEASTLVDSLHTAGAHHVLWLTLPAKAGTEPNPRVDAFNALVGAVAVTRPWMQQPDYSGYIAGLGPERDPRPDGVHLSMGTAGPVWQEWLNPIVLDAARSTS